MRLHQWFVEHKIPSPNIATHNNNHLLLSSCLLVSHDSSNPGLAQLTLISIVHAFEGEMKSQFLAGLLGSSIWYVSPAPPETCGLTQISPSLAQFCKHLLRQFVLYILTSHWPKQDTWCCQKAKNYALSPQEGTTKLHDKKKGYRLREKFGPLIQSTREGKK